MQTDISEFKITHSKDDYNQHIHQDNSELLGMSKKNIIINNLSTY